MEESTNSPIEVVEQGGIFIARYAGKPNRTFGTTKKDAVNKLTSSEWAAHSVNRRTPAEHQAVWGGFAPGGKHIFQEVTL